MGILNMKAFLVILEILHLQKEEPLAIMPVGKK